MILLLDSAPLGLAVHPQPHPEFDAWFEATVSGDFTLMVPEIVDYELRRELLRLDSQKSIARLDELEARTR